MIKKNIKKLIFQNLDHDIERCCVETSETILGTPVFRGLHEAQEHVFSAYLEKKLYGLVLEYLLTNFNWEWGINDYVERATEAFKQDEELTKLKRLWHGVTASQKHHFWALYAIRDKEPDAKTSLPKVKAIALQHMSRFREILLGIDDAEELSRLEEEIGFLEREERRKIKPNLDLRKIDEKLFWELIEEARHSCDSVTEQIALLVSILEKFKASDIKRFQKILDEKMRDAYRWDLWALAYIAQRGCSDDAFEGFRAWLILQGRKIFELALTDIQKIMDKVPAGLGTQAEGLLSVPEIAYESRTGKFLRSRKVSSYKLKGVQWEEEQLESFYPEVCKFYSFGV
jgi:hypothetical protein